MWTDVRRADNQILWLAGLVLAFVVLRILMDYSVLGISFIYQHVDPTSVFAIGGRNFLQHGFVSGLVPLVNNPPFDLSADVYPSWPPLNYFYVGLISQPFGGAHWAVHGAMLLVQLASAATIFLLTRRVAGIAAAMLAALFFLYAPVNFEHSHIASHTPLAILLVCVTVYAATRYLTDPAAGLGWLCAAMGVYLLACGTSWEAYCALPGWALLVLLLQTRRSLYCLLGLGATAGATGLAVLVLYVVGSEQAAGHLYWKLGNRTILDGTPVGDAVAWLFRNVEPIPSADIVAGEGPDFWIVDAAQMMIDTLPTMGILVLPAVAMVAVALLRAAGPAVRIRPLSAAESGLVPFLVVVLPLASMLLFWSVLFNWQYLRHDYEAMLGVPFVAVCSGILLGKLIEWIWRPPGSPGTRAAEVWETMRLSAPRAGRFMAVAFVAVLLVFPNLAEAAWRLAMTQVEYRMERFSAFVRDSTEPGTVVVVPHHYSTGLVYFSERRIELLTPEQYDRLPVTVAEIAERHDGAPLALAVFVDDFESFEPRLTLEGEDIRSDIGLVRILDEPEPAEAEEEEEISLGAPPAPADDEGGTATP